MKRYIWIGMTALFLMTAMAGLWEERGDGSDGNNPGGDD